MAILTMILTLLGEVCYDVPRVHASEAEEEQILEGLSESEREQFLEELYRDMEAEEVPREPVSGILSGSGRDFSDEETAESIREMLPDQQILEGLAQEAQTRVIAVANLRSGYDADRELYQYTFADGGEKVFLSVPLGGWSDHAVALMPGEGTRISALYRDGVTLDQSPGEEGTYFLRETGRYAFQIVTEESGESFLGYFRIVSPQIPVRDSQLWSPEDYRLTGATCGGKELSVEDGRWLALDGDGIYELTYTVIREIPGFPRTWSVVFLRDTTPPVMEWEGELKEGKFLGSVHFSVDDPEAAVEIWHNGRPAVAETGTIATPGSYYVTATDLSGNMQSWHFVVEHRDQFPVKLLGIAGGIILVSLLIMFLTARLGMRIR